MGLFSESDNSFLKGVKVFFTGCGAVSFIMFALVMCVGILVDDDEDEDKKDVTESQVGLSEARADSVQRRDVLEGDPMKELESLTGMPEVKKEVKSLANFIKVQKQREAQGLKTPKISYHLVFTGSPGTGKTTVARIIARIYKDLGVLKSGHLVETDRSGLIAEYVGQTGVKTNHLCDSALNGVLFIDEAYSLVDEGVGGYGNEALATLLKRMEDDRDRLVVIVAGYTNEMKRFIDSNPGLQSRFNRYINFPDFKPGELVEIFMNRMNKYGYKLDDDADKYLREKFKYVYQHKSKNFGNGRYVRNVFEQTITEQANRVAKYSTPSKSELSTITVEDLRKACDFVKY